MRLEVDHDHLRPGGTVSGPSMFTLADALMYAAILSKVGPKALAVTTNCSIDFLRKPAAGKDLLARCHILKLGKVLVVGDVLMYSVTSNPVTTTSTCTRIEDDSTDSDSDSDHGSSSSCSVSSSNESSTTSDDDCNSSGGGGSDSSFMAEGRGLEEYVNIDQPVCRATMTYSLPK